jgi:TolA-binding protein
MSFRWGILASLLFAAVAQAAAPSTCGLTDDYSRGLCAYQRRHFAQAESAFGAIADRDAKEPQTIRALYFLARTHMKQGRWDDASAVLIRIYLLDKPFYDAWACDFLLGECRRAAGKG